MKIVFLAIIVFISIASFYSIIPSGSLVEIYGIIAILPFAFILLRKNLFFGLLLWFVFTMFKRLMEVEIPLLPDMPPHRILWIGIVFMSILDFTMGKRKIMRITIMETAMLLFILYMAFSGIISGTLYEEGHGLKISYILKYFIPFSFFFFAKHIIDDEDKIRKAFMFFTIVGLYLGLTGVFEHFNLKYLVFPDYIMDRTVGIHWGQARGPFVQAATNSMSMAIFLLLAYYLYIFDRGKRTRPIIFFAIIFMIVGIVFSYNRGTWLSFAIASLMVPIFFPPARKTFVFGYVLIGCAVLMVLISTWSADFNPKLKVARNLKDAKSTTEAMQNRLSSTGSLQSRFGIQMVALRMASEKPLLGYGFNKFKEVSPEYFEKTKGLDYILGKGLATHNAFLLILVELGLIGLVPFLIIFIYPFIICIKLYRELPEDVFIGKGLPVIGSVIFAMFVLSMFARGISLSEFTNALYFFIVGIMSGLYERLKEEKYSSHGISY